MAVIERDIAEAIRARNIEHVDVKTSFKAI